MVEHGDGPGAGLRLLSTGGAGVPPSLRPQRSTADTMIVQGPRGLQAGLLPGCPAPPVGSAPGGWSPSRCWACLPSVCTGLRTLGRSASTVTSAPSSRHQLAIPPSSPGTLLLLHWLWEMRPSHPFRKPVLGLTQRAAPGGHPGLPLRPTQPPGSAVRAASSRQEDPALCLGRRISDSKHAHS